MGAIVAKIYLFLIGTICGVIGVVELYRRLQLLFFGTRTEGTFIEWKSSGLRRKYYHPVVEFEKRDGTCHRITGVGGFSRIPAEPKAAYKVIYLEEAPEKGMVFSLLHFWAAPMVFLMFSGLGLWLAATR